MMPPSGNGTKAPAFAEVMEIVERRQRNRHRIVRGAAVVTVLTGAGIGLNSLIGGGDAQIVPDPVPVAPADEPTTTLAEQTCGGVGDRTAAGELLAAGYDAFFDQQAVSFDDAQSIATEWQVDINEVKSVAGLSVDSAVPFDGSLSDRAINEWPNSGHGPEDLQVIAEEWNVSIITVKVLNLLDTPAVNEVLDPCR